MLMGTTLLFGASCLMTVNQTPLAAQARAARVLIQLFAVLISASILAYKRLIFTNMKLSIKITMFGAIALTIFGLSSCKKYLDRPPEAVINEQDVFANFR